MSGHTAALLAIALAGCTGRAAAQQPMAERPIGPIVARTHDVLGSVGWVRPLSDGRVVVNDKVTRRVLLFDSSLSHPLVIADTTGASARAYGNGLASPGALIPYLGDSTLFLDEKSESLLLIDPSGKIDRTLSVPIPGTSSGLWGNGPPGTDHQGRIVFRLNARRTGQLFGPVTADTAAVVRVSLTTHTVDTVGFIRVQAIVNVSTGTNDQGAPTGRTLGVPFDVDDDWALLADGSIALVRGQDVHVDFVTEQGGRTSTPGIPVRWKRLSDSDKVALVDSMRRADSISQAEQAAVRHAPLPGPQPLIAASDIPDYRPAFSTATTRGDAEGNLWIKLNEPLASPGGAVYWVVNHLGQVIDRVKLPGGCTLVGFGPGVVYLSSREGSGVVLARARIR
ncbi:MAG TPA: hypothetical protein VMH39_05810 [Gemmatimonadaceae bacterium]|nr:hypothetical protein [Gemmatimonadaceae bacterium]